MTIECIDNERGFLALGAEWETLRQRSERPSYFLSHDWFRCCWQELKSRSSLRVFVVREADRPVLIAPCMLSRLTKRWLPISHLTFIEHPETQTAGFLIAADTSAPAALDAWLRYLLAQRAGDWDVLALDKIPSDGPSASSVGAILQHDRRDYQLGGSHESLVLPLDGCWEDYAARQSPRFRKTLRNIANRIQKLGRVELRSYQGKQDAAEALDKLFSVSQASWKVADQIAITSSAERMAFFRGLASTDVTAAGLRIILLDVDGTPIASEIQVLDGAIVYALRSDYDEQFADSSPGTFLQMEILKELFPSPYAEYNFGVGLNPYKTRWTEERRQLVKLQLHNDTIRGRILNTVARCQPTLARLPGVQLLNGLIAGKSA